MKPTDIQQLIRQIQQPKFSHESRRLANELILEYNITEYDIVDSTRTQTCDKIYPTII